MKTPHILLHSGWDTFNLGDIGHTPGALRLLEQHLPETPVTLWLENSNEEIRQHFKTRFPNVTIVQGGFSDGEPCGKELLEAFDRATLFVRSSGMGWPFPTFKYCRRIRLAYGVIGNSFNNDFPYGDDELIEILRGALFVYARESNTLETLQRAGLYSPQTQFAPDTCLATDLRDDSAGDAFLQQYGLEAGRYLTFQLRTYTHKHPGVDGGPLNPLHPTPENIKHDERRAAKFRHVITGWVRRTGQPALLALEVKKELAHNRRLIVDQLPDDVRKKVIVPQTFWNLPTAASVLARATLSLCHEPHTLLLALANGTPVIHAYTEDHGPKWRMFNDFGLTESLISLDRVPAETLLKACLSTAAESTSARARVVKAMELAELRWKSALAPLFRYCKPNK